ncbi:NAD(P)/FAD-dependent oxidoreductase [Streptomyces sp. NBC_00053]|uniref:flavin-containing monooxygenase n=1 Tax=unclassified Streptomyces TaxID=2593676 RepID=UPI00225515C7|nr:MULTISPECIES: NAD(P)/FAD-dependent oxidoreductase [unclassified Streptomyces]WSX02048.1 NAD(P)/FAD-dependent oxidoreductase [Streptomyces sp. NBC_00987]MCX5501079.1 NAD(P)/FAD-dependent oxidoreductase [Streptomyces sp. NBC_00052]MCX5550386.1 NAD(P)/FAD-dependent oxidoreductase [Streptomyces sp. NBC_00051]WSC29656.1 NAD(P)/FAD-dependent oxidoreductase [Streptomyces sp. NBC_01768]WSP48506.1 NAD(P)/FAD-dependent oxidoreductase [Streptomyces sp. NBC_01243]
MEHVDVAVIGGGQSGLAAARALVQHGIAPVVLEASGWAAGSWPRYYDSLTLFSPARYSALPGLRFGGDPQRYPHRDEVVDYLLRYAARLDAGIRTGRRVDQVRSEGPGFLLTLADGSQLGARAVVAASGGFGCPSRPALPGLESFTGTVLHAAHYRNPEPFAGQRVLVVGGGNSAVQIAAELAGHARVSLASRSAVRWFKQRPLAGRDLHFWLKVTGLDIAPLGRFQRAPATMAVIDDGRYRAALAANEPDQRSMFASVEGSKVLWPDGRAEEVDAIVLATGYRPDVGYLSPLGVLDGHGRPRHRDGIALAHPGLAFVGLEWQRSLSSASLRGVGRDAARIARRLAAHLAWR